MSNPAYQKLKDTHALPSPPAVVLEILRLTGNDNASLSSISEVVESDPALAARTLRLINSPFAGLSRRIGSVSVAVVLLGMRTIKNLALSLSLLAGNHKGRCAAFPYKEFWSESLARAVAARRIAHHLKNFPPDEAFTVGLLAKIGRLGLATGCPTEYARIMASSGASDGDGLLRLEREAFGLDHNELSSEMLVDWRLPELICNAVRFQDAPDRAGADGGPRSALLARVLHLAGAIASRLVQPDAALERLTLLASEAEALGIPATQFDAFFDANVSEWHEAGAILSVPTAAVPSLAELRARIQDARQPDEDRSAPDVPPGPAAKAPADRLRVLLVDDDPAALRLITKFLGGAGYDVMTAANGMEALEIDRTWAPQIVITDWLMPDVDGLELCRRLRANEEVGFVYVIVLSAQSEKERVVEALEAGADDFVLKPFSSQELLAHVRAGDRIARLESKLVERGREVSRANAQLAAANDRLRIAATSDELTGLANRREGLARLADHWAVAQRRGEALSCIVVDIDHFKQINDRHGHPTGDAVLRAVAATLQKATRRGEPICRVGGEEFLVICPGSPAALAAQGAERLRLALESHPITSNAIHVPVTISLGVAERTPAMAGPDDLLKAADEMLYLAKATGKNRVCAAGGCPALAGVAEGRGELAEQPSDTSVAGVSGSPARVLVVDDDRLTRTLCRRLIEREGYTVWEASDGLEALEEVYRCSPDVIVLDAMMPRLDGLECARRLKADAATRDIPIIMLSAAGDSADIESGLRAGADEYVTKPIKPREFALRVRSMVCLHRSIVELSWSNATRWEQTRFLQLLLDFSCGLVGEGRLERILELIVSTASELTRSSRVSVMLPDSGRRHLTIAHAVGIDEQVAAEIVVPAGEGVAGMVFLTGEQAVVNGPDEAGADRHGCDSRFFASVPLVSTALRAKGRVLGALNVTNREGARPFTARELEVLDLLCNVAATAIDALQSRAAHDNAQDSIVFALATLAEHRDVETGAHLHRVTQYASMLAENLRERGRFLDAIDDEFMRALERGMPLHDIGKVAIPDSILLKPGRLTDAEIVQMRRHAEIGGRIIRSVRERTPGAGFLLVAEQIASGHHEHWDGTGYPAGLTGPSIPLSARLAAVADVYDALTTDRVYRPAFTHEAAAGIIRDGTGTQFDPTIVEAFFALESQLSQVVMAASPARRDSGGRPGRVESYRDSQRASGVSRAAVA